MLVIVSLPVRKHSTTTKMLNALELDDVHDCLDIAIMVIIPDTSEHNIMTRTAYIHAK